MGITRSQPGKQKTHTHFFQAEEGGGLAEHEGKLQNHRLPDPNQAKSTHFFQAEEGGGLAEHEGSCIFTDYQIPTRQQKKNTHTHISSKQRKGDAWQNTRGAADSQITRPNPAKTTHFFR